MLSRPYGTGHLSQATRLLKCWAIFGRPYGTPSLSSQYWDRTPEPESVRSNGQGQLRVSHGLAVIDREHVLELGFGLTLDYVQLRHRVQALG